MKLRVNWSSGDTEEYEFPLINMSKLQILNAVVDRRTLHYLDRGGEVTVLNFDRAECVKVVCDWSDLELYDEAVQWYEDNPILF